MTHFILIVMLLSSDIDARSGAATLSVEFDNVAACNAAAEAARANANGASVRAFCTPRFK